MSDSARVCMVAYTHYETDPRVRREAEALVDAGMQVDFLALRRVGQSPHETIQGVDVFHLDQDRYRGGSGVKYIAAYVLFLFRVSWWLFRNSRRRLHRLIHVNTMPDFMVLCALWPQMIHRVPVLLDIHDVMPEIFAGKFGVSLNHWKIRLLRWQEVWSARVATAVLTVHEPLVDVLESHGVNRRKVSVLLNLPDESIFGSVDQPPVPEETDRFRIVHHGTLAHRLGLDIAIEALATFRSEMDAIGPWQLEVYGEGDHRPALMELAERFDLTDRVQFSEGFVPTHELPDRLRGAALGLVPLRLQSDTELMLPTKMLEYIQLGIPVIARETKVLTHHFREGQTTLVDSEEPGVWGEAILSLRRDPDRRRRQAESARLFARSHRWSTHRQRYVDLVRGLIRLRAPRQGREGDSSGGQGDI